MSIRRQSREKVFGPGCQIPLDHNQKARIEAYARAWSARHKGGQHHGPITMAFRRVLRALLWGFHNSATGACFPSYEKIAEKAECARSTVAEAIKALEFAGVLTWQNRIVRVRERVQDLFGRAVNRWRVVRTSNAYVLVDPSKSENQTGTQKEFTLDTVRRVSDARGMPEIDLTTPLERALARLEAAVKAKCIEQGAL